MDTTPAQKGSAARGERLDSWKEIAAYLKRDIRTVQRWEKHEALPVHRHVHEDRGTAYAFSHEIDEWLRNRTRSVTEATPTNRVSRLPSLPIAIGIGIATGVLGFWALSPRSPASLPLSSFSVTFTEGEAVREWGPDQALSPDGSTLVYTLANGQLRVRRTHELLGRPIADTLGAWGPFFSPNGRWIGFNRAGELMKVPVDGGAPVPIGATTGFMGSADWGSDDQIVYAAATPAGTSGLYRVSANGGASQLIAALDGNADAVYWLTPQWLSNGKMILCTVARTVESGSRFQAVVVSVATGERRVLIDDARHAKYIGDDVLVYWRDNALFATRFDPDRAVVQGPHVLARDEVHERVRMPSWASAGGMLVYWPGIRVAHRLVWVDRSGKQEPLPLPPAMYHAPRVSPDGRSIAYAVGHEFSDIWKYDLVTGVTVRLTSDGRSAAPLWTPDGTTLMISSLQPKGRNLARLRLVPGAKPEPLSVGQTFLAGASKLPASWADGGRTLIVRQFGLSAEPALWALPLDQTAGPLPLELRRATTGQVSPDGRWIVYGAAGEVFVAPFPAGQPQWKVSTTGGGLPIWARSGREVFYRKGTALYAASLTPGETITVSPAQKLFDIPFYEGDPGSPNYDVAPDSQRFLFVLPGSTGGPDRLNVVLGFRDDILRRLADAS